MGVEVHQGDVTEAVYPGHAEGVGPGDRVIAAEDDRHLSRSRHLLHGVRDPGDGHIQLSGPHVYVSGVDHSQQPERVDTGGEMGAVAVHGAVVGASDRLGPEPGAGSIGGPPIEGRPQDDHVSIAQFLELDGGDPQERIPRRKGDVLGGGERNLLLALFVGDVHPSLR